MGKSDEQWSRQVFQRGAGAIGAMVILALTPVIPAFSQGVPAGACVQMEPTQVYARMKKETMSHRTYTAVYYHASERGKNHEVWAKMTCSGRYIQTPAQYCEKRLKVETSFPEQAGAGFQECYSGQEDMTRLLMPGVYRGLGVIPMFPEDPKASYLNGENLKKAAVWTWFAEWDRMLVGGKLTAECESRKGKPVWTLTLKRGTNPDPVYHHDLVKISVDTTTWFPLRVETYVPGDPKPVVIYDFQEVKLDVPLTEKDMTFEGLAPGWNLVSVPSGPKLKTLAQEEPRLAPVSDQNPAAFLSSLDQALAKINDYETNLILELRYKRLRQYKEDSFKFIKPRSFSALTTHLEANYLLINGGEGFRVVFDPSRDLKLHIIPAGMYKVMGEQTFPPDDPRLFSNMGDDVIRLSFFAIREELKRRLETAVGKKVALATYRDCQGQWLEVEGKDLGIPQQPRVMRLLLDNQNHLPLRLEYRGYDDKTAYIMVRFKNTKVNLGLKAADLWK